ncbi:MAG: lysozyme [Erythrobacter sp.]
MFGKTAISKPPGDAPNSQNHTTTKRKPIFDTVRAILGRGFRQPEVDALDKTLDSALNQATGQDAVDLDALPRGDAPSPSIRTVSAKGTALIKRFEGCARLREDGLIEAYPDPATGGEPWTIGWGATRNGLHGFVGPDTVWTQQQADERLEDDLRIYAADVADAIGDTPTSQAQFDAMVSLHYNTGAIARATLTQRHINGDYRAAKREFARWNRADGRVLRGLSLRREAEAMLYGGAA